MLTFLAVFALNGNSTGSPFDFPSAKGAAAMPTEYKTTVKVRSPKDLQSAFLTARASLAKGNLTRIILAPGIYREAVLNVDWSVGLASETPLLIEGAGRVFWSGADLFPLSGWKKVGPIFRHAWPYRWGNFGYSWSAKGLIGHLSEMMAINGIPLMPRILDRYAIDGIVQDPAHPGEIQYRFLETRDPAAVLAPGEFGVTERGPDGPRIFFRPRNDAVSTRDRIEVSVRPNLLDLRGKSRVVIRNITFTQTANSDHDFGASNAIRFSIDPAHLSHDVLIDRCKVLWSAQSGLHIDGSHWTIRDSEFSYNGGSGIAAGKSSDIRWERNRTNFNVWRLWRAGELGYYTGGFKMHETTGHTILGHEAIGNCTMGAWWDVHCRDVRIRDLVAVGNAANLQFELCEGPFDADRIVVAGGRAGDGQLRLWEHGATRLRHSILYSNYRGSGTTGLYNLRWFGRTDQHAAIAKITAGENLANDNVFLAGPNVPNFGMIDDIRGAEWSNREPMSYRGLRNLFWNPSQPEFFRRWIKDGDRTGELAARAISVENWLRPETYSEASPTVADPQLRDPEGFDYRFLPSSPLYSRRGDFPQVHLSQALRAEWKWFSDWSGYKPGVWNEPPVE